MNDRCFVGDLMDLMESWLTICTLATNSGVLMSQRELLLLLLLDTFY